MSAVEAGDLIHGRFRLVERIGTGGMGTVFRAVDQTTSQPVALKILSGRDEVEVERARREARVLARLAHPSIVGYVDDGVTDSGDHYLAMQWVPGKTLAERLDTTGFTLRQAVAILRQTAQTLESAHRSGVLHRDIKPSNILLVEPDDRVVLIDFGIARIADTISSLTRTGLAIGTPGFMSPEQARGERDVTTATDVFALGCVFYTCATGHPAFSGSNAAAVLVKILLANPTPLELVVPEAPRELCNLVAQMLQKDVARRTPDCTAVLRALEAIPPIPHGPRRGGANLEAPTQLSTAHTDDARVHCMVMAAQGALDDVFDPPDDEERAALASSLAPFDAELGVCANGSLVVHVRGEPGATMQRAAQCALALRVRLPGWSIAISAERPDAAEAAEAGAGLLASTAISDLFGEARGVAIEPSSIPVLRGAIIERVDERVTLLGLRS